MKNRIYKNNIILAFGATKLFLENEKRQGRIPADVKFLQLPILYKIESSPYDIKLSKSLGKQADVLIKTGDDYYTLKYFNTSEAAMSKEEYKELAEQYETLADLIQIVSYDSATLQSSEEILNQMDDNEIDKELFTFKDICGYDDWNFEGNHQLMDLLYENHEKLVTGEMGKEMTQGYVDNYEFRKNFDEGEIKKRRRSPIIKILKEEITGPPLEVITLYYDVPRSYFTEEDMSSPGTDEEIAGGIHYKRQGDK